MQGCGDMDKLGGGGTQIQAPSRRYFWIFFIKPIVAHTQILVHTCKGLGKGFRRHFADGLNQSLVSSVVQAVYEEKLLKYKHMSSNKQIF